MSSIRSSGSGTGCAPVHHPRRPWRNGARHAQGRRSVAATPRSNHSSCYRPKWNTNGEADTSTIRLRPGTDVSRNLACARNRQTDCPKPRCDSATVIALPVITRPLVSITIRATTLPSRVDRKSAGCSGPRPGRNASREPAPATVITVVSTRTSITPRHARGAEPGVGCALDTASYITIGTKNRRTIKTYLLGEWIRPGSRTDSRGLRKEPSRSPSSATCLRGVRLHCTSLVRADRSRP